MVRLLLLRHGQIRANHQGLWHGSTDSPLTWRGRRQARRTARHLSAATTPVAAIYSSPMERCRDTADIVARRLKLEVATVEDLREYAIGEWEGKPFRDLAEQHGFVHQATGDHTFAPPGGESLGGVAARIVPALEQIAAAHSADDLVLVVGHGAAMAVAVSALIDGNPSNWVNYHFANCSLTELVLGPCPYVNWFNSTAHL